MAVVVDSGIAGLHVGWASASAYFVLVFFYISPMSRFPSPACFDQSSGSCGFCRGCWLQTVIHDGVWQLESIILKLVIIQVVYPPISFPKRWASSWYTNARGSLPLASRMTCLQSQFRNTKNILGAFQNTNFRKKYYCHPTLQLHPEILHEERTTSPNLARCPWRALSHSSIFRHA